MTEEVPADTPQVELGFQSVDPADAEKGPFFLSFLFLHAFNSRSTDQSPGE